MPLEEDILEQVRADFPAKAVRGVSESLSSLPHGARIRRCIVVAARGRIRHFKYFCRLADQDYRDLIVAAEYDGSGRRQYDFNRPIPEARIDPPEGPG